MNKHWLLGVDLEKYEITNFPTHLEIKTKAEPKRVWNIPKPYSLQEGEWWIDRVKELKID